MKQKIYINPPPRDRCCEVCRKNIKDLEPFGKGNFEGSMLVKTFRTMHPHIKEMDEEVAKVKDWGKLSKKNLQKAEELSFYDQMVNTVEASWECSSCLCLGDEEYFEKRKEMNKK